MTHLFEILLKVTSGLLLSVVLGSTAFAQITLDQLLAQRFYTDAYRSGECGTNIMKLVEEAHGRRLDLSRANMLKITSPGFVHLEGIRGYAARNQGQLISPQTFRRDARYPEHEILRTPGEKFWYHHVVLEKDGVIYDFDFLNEPTPKSVEVYFREMFYPSGLSGYAGRADFPDKVKDGYAVEVIPVELFLEHRALGRPISTFSPRDRSTILRLRPYLDNQTAQRPQAHSCSEGFSAVGFSI